MALTPEQLKRVERIRASREPQATPQLQQTRNGELREPPKPAIPKLDLIEMSKLSKQTFPPRKWIVPGWIGMGCTVIAGKPKIGKSSLIVAMAHAITNGGTFFNQPCEKRGVLYVTLEDDEQTLNERGNKIAPDWANGFLLCFEARNLDTGLINQLNQAVADHPKIGVIFLDVLVRLKGAKRNNEQPYEHDSRAAREFKDFSKRTGIPTVVVHHCRKTGSTSDVFDEIHGSTGLIGAVDTGIVIIPQPGTPVMRFYARGRTVREIDKLIDADLDRNSWEIIDDYHQETESNATQIKILTALENAPKGYPMGPKELSAAVGTSETNVSMHLARLRQLGKAVRIRQGAWVANSGPNKKSQ